MVKKRTSGGGLGVILAQHFDTGIDLVRRLTGELVARFDKIGTDSDPQIVTGTIGRRMGSFLMQLVASPSTRPAYGHLWGLGGVAAIHNGDGTATPILDAWANKDTDIAALTVDVGTQSVSAGDFGVIMRGSNDDAQSLVFLKGGSGGGGGGGIPGWYGSGIDGSVHLTSNPPALSGVYSSYNGVTSAVGNKPDPDTGGNWGVHADDVPLTIAFTGSALISASNGGGSVGIRLDQIDSSKTYHFLQHTAYCTDLTIDSDVVLVPQSYAVLYTGTLQLDGEISGDGDLEKIHASVTDDASIFRTALVTAVVYERDTFAWEPPNGPAALVTAGPGGANGKNGAPSIAPPPFDEQQTAHKSGAGGGAGPQTGGNPAGSGYYTGHPMNREPYASEGASSIRTGAWPITPMAGGASGGGGAAYMASFSLGGRATGGLGGPGACPVMVRGKTTSGSGKIRSRGGTGDDGKVVGAVGDAGGGGGGNGGTIMHFTESTGSVAYDVSKGTGGAGTGTGSNGAAGGTDGRIFKGNPLTG